MYINYQTNFKEKVLDFSPGTVIEDETILYCRIIGSGVVFKNCIIQGCIIIGVHEFVDCCMGTNMYPECVMPGD